MEQHHVLETGVAPWDAGDYVALATVVSTVGSSPRDIGTTMAIASDGAVWGSLSGGCVEGDVHARAMRVLASGRPELVQYGVSDEEAFGVGLTCGGTIEVFIDRVSRRHSPELAAFVREVRARRGATLITLIEHPDARYVGRQAQVGDDSSSGAIGGSRLADATESDARGFLAAGKSGTLTYGPSGQRRGSGARALFTTSTPQPRMLVFGSTDFARAATAQGRLLGYRVTVCDARAAFTTPSRFPAADEVVIDWPHRYLAQQAEGGRLHPRDVICVLSHDPKFDIPLLELALQLPADVQPHYIGAMGSRRTHERRTVELLERGLTPANLSRLSSPIGLDLGARTPEETAVSIAAEIVADRWNGSGQRLSATSDPIHTDPQPATELPSVHDSA